MSQKLLFFPEFFLGGDGDYVVVIWSENWIPCGPMDLGHRELLAELLLAPPEARCAMMRHYGSMGHSLHRSYSPLGRELQCPSLDWQQNPGAELLLRKGPASS